MSEEIKNHPTLTPQKIKEIIEKEEKTKNVEVIESHLTAGTGKGENYSSLLVACDVEAKVNGETKEYHWMVKLPQTEPNKAKWNAAIQMEEKEILYYTEFLPKLSEFVSQYMDDNQINVSHVPHAFYEKDKYSECMLVMTNLKKSGYEDPVNKKSGLSLSHSKLVLDELAKLHASSYAYFHKYPGGIEKCMKDNLLFTRLNLFEESDVAEVTQGLKFWETNALKGLKNVLYAVQEEGQNFCTPVMDYIDKHLNGEMDFLKLFSSGDEYQFKVLCHGDPWFNNMMFRYENNENEKIPKECVMIDLALGNWNTPAYDLNYFFFTSVTPFFRKTHLDELLGHYHDKLISLLVKFGFDPSIYPYRQLVKEYKAKNDLGFIWSAQCAPLMLANKEDAVGQEDYDIDLTDEKAFEEMMTAMVERQIQSIRNNPQIKLLIVGNFFEVLENGMFNR